MENQPSQEVSENTNTPTVEDLFKIFKREEERPADPNEEILIGQIKETDPEYQRLLQIGLTPKERQRKLLKRR